MALVNIGGQLNLTQETANVDRKYGPYNSLSDAWTMIDDEGWAALGLTVGVKTGNSIVEYWFKDGIEQENLVLKNPSELPSGGSEGQVLKKTSEGVEWANETQELPDITEAGKYLKTVSSGTGISTEWADVDALPDKTQNQGKVLRVNSDASAVIWDNETKELPESGNGVLKKSTDDTIAWGTVNEVPSTGTTGNVLTKTDSGYEFAAVPTELPTIASGDRGKALKVNTNENGVEWSTINELPSTDGATNGQIVQLTETGAKWADNVKGVPEYSAVTEGSVLRKGTTDIAWGAVREYPAIDGQSGKVLKVSESGGSVEWADETKELPDGGENGQVLTKSADGVTWANSTGIPAGGSTNQVLKKTSDENYAVQWADESGGGSEPAAYLKSASVSGNTLVIVNKSGSEEVSYTPTIPEVYVQSVAGEEAAETGALTGKLTFTQQEQVEGEVQTKTYYYTAVQKVNDKEPSDGSVTLTGEDIKVNTGEESTTTIANKFATITESIPTAYIASAEYGEDKVLTITPKEGDAITTDPIPTEYLKSASYEDNVLTINPNTGDAISATIPSTYLVEADTSATNTLVLTDNNRNQKTFNVALPADYITTITGSETASEQLSGTLTIKTNKDDTGKTFKTVQKVNSVETPATGEVTIYGSDISTSATDPTTLATYVTNLSTKAETALNKESSSTTISANDIIVGTTDGTVKGFSIGSSNNGKVLTVGAGGDSLEWTTNPQGTLKSVTVQPKAAGEGEITNPIQITDATASGESGTIYIGLASDKYIPTLTEWNTLLSAQAADAAKIAELETYKQYTGTVTSVKLEAIANSGLSITNSTVTKEGTIKIGVSDGYKIPTTDELHSPVVYCTRMSSTSAGETPQQETNPVAITIIACDQNAYNYYMDDEGGHTEERNPNALYVVTGIGSSATIDTPTVTWGGDSNTDYTYFTWTMDDETGIAGYHVYANNTLVATVAQGETYEYNNIATSVEYVVKAYKYVAGGMVESSKTTTNTLKVPMTTITPVLNAFEDKNFTLTWPTITGANHYEVYNETTGTTIKSDVSQSETSTISFCPASIASERDLSSSVSYKVRAVFTPATGSTGRNTIYSDYSEAKAMSLTAPTIAFVSDADFTITWADYAQSATNVTHIALYQQAPGAGSGTLIDEYDISGDTKKYENVQSGYTYWAVAEQKLDAGTYQSAISNTKQVMLNKPSVTFASTDDNTSITWTAISGATGYYVYRNTTGTQPSESTDPTEYVTTTSYTTTDLSNGKAYYYWVRAIQNVTTTAQTARIIKSAYNDINGIQPGVVSVKYKVSPTGKVQGYLDASYTQAITPETEIKYVKGTTNVTWYFKTTDDEYTFATDETEAIKAYDGSNLSDSEYANISWTATE